VSEAIHVVCGSCDRVNRIPVSKLSAGGRCGACSTPLFPHEVIQLDKARFKRHIEKSDIPILVDFWASWCGPCKIMAPIFEQAARQLEPRCRLVKVNTEVEQSLAGEYQIRSIPSLLMFKGGREVARSAGAMDLQQLLSWVKLYL